MRKVICVLLFTAGVSGLFAQPLDGIVKREVIKEKMPLAYEPLREADILWEKRLWQVIDVREKQNLHFSNPDRPLFDIILEAAENEDIIVYGTEDDKFTKPLLPEELNQILYTTDTVTIFDPELYTEDFTIVQTGTHAEEIKRYRIKEIWFFNSKTAQMDVRIIGIAPMKNVTDEQGNFLYEMPLFWAYFPELREVLANELVFNSNSASQITWDDWFEQRRFSSSVYKENNIHDRRLKDYLAGRDLLTEGGKIKSEIFDFEQDVWSR